jgi:hypothetical protein
VDTLALFQAASTCFFGQCTHKWFEISQDDMGLYLLDEAGNAGSG